MVSNAKVAEHRIIIQIELGDHLFGRKSVGVIIANALLSLVLRVRENQLRALPGGSGEGDGGQRYQG